MYCGETQPGSILDTCVVVDGAPWANQKHPLHPKHQTSCSADPVCLPTHHVHLLHLGLSAPSTQLGRADAQESFAELTWWLLILLLQARHKFIKKRIEHSLTQLPPQTGKTLPWMPRSLGPDVCACSQRSPVTRHFLL